MIARSRFAALVLPFAALLLLGTPLAPAQTPAATPAGSPSPAAASTDIIGVIEAAGNFKTFLKALDAAGLTATLKKSGTYTVFAPTDEAFAKFPAGTLDTLLKAENKPKLIALLSYHMASRKWTAAEIAKTDEIKTMEGTVIDVDASVDGKTLELDDSKVTTSDLPASNGIVHVIDKVLQP
jgi:uncharacterized surface protein with fasciclin (FAS1) repeats